MVLMDVNGGVTLSWKLWNNCIFWTITLQFASKKPMEVQNCKSIRCSILTAKIKHWQHQETDRAPNLQTWLDKVQNPCKLDKSMKCWHFGDTRDFHLTTEMCLQSQTRAQFAQLHSEHFETDLICTSHLSWNLKWILSGLKIPSECYLNATACHCTQFNAKK